MLDEYPIEVTHGTSVLATGTLIIDTSTKPPTGTFIPTGGTEVPCNVSSWSLAPHGATNWSFTLRAPNGEFPIKVSGGAFSYIFLGTEGPEGPGGTVNWPNIHDDIEETVTWQSEATQPEPYAQGQAAS